MKAHFTLAPILLLTIAGCTQPAAAPAAANPPVPPKPKSTSPYARDYYQKVRAMPIKEFAELVKPGTPMSQVTDIMGRPTTFGVSTASKSGTVTFNRMDGVVKVQITNEKVTKVDIEPLKPPTP